MANQTQSKQIRIVKASGETELFAESKLRASLKRAGASEGSINSVVHDVTDRLHEGMTTKDIYSRAFSHLRRKDRPTAGRYHLRMALMEFGPSGHPFEKFVGELLKAEGFDVEVARIVQGVCVKHEVDVVATRGDRHVMVECKFHNQPGLRSDVKISLYVQARFEDVERQWKKQPNHGEKFHEVWLVTNTKLTTDATRYAECVGMHALGWSYPSTGSLEQLVERYGLHPVTCLTLLNRMQKQEMMRQGFILCKDVLEHPDALRRVFRNPARAEDVLQEARELIKAI
ncbi:ATPase [Candidatus Kaiserbacteria bacterium RIFCSPHIGHO2_01_FULL_54_36b]|uniref:ATPase n=1 Tax=Candidatus Kaiserbacteria bacterium RIFCSPHIGHO2_01_FULL_54_36b TaxID=1798483 RepID=A0A1F6CNH0_9BACT|nr:MAG: ATPase [Candidatus Kaiserbacteria bacterium RIFCSPHIGHO2_01_FULL_54_36b]